MKTFAAALLCLAVPAIAQTAEPQTFSPEAFKSHVAFLADDLLQGRQPGEPGHQIAMRYMVSQFMAAGLTPAGDNGSWYQKVPLREARLVKGSSFVTIGGNPRRANGAGFFTGPSMTEMSQNRSAGVVFAGHCLYEPSLRIDDFKGLDVKGKFVACLPGFPKGLPSETAAFLTDQRARFVVQRGGIGIIGLWDAVQEKRVPFARLAATIDNPRMQRFNPDGSVYQFAPGLLAEGVLASPAIDELFAGAPRRFADVANEGASKSVKGFALKQRVTFQREATWKTIESANVVGMVKGTDAAVSGQYVVLGAHLDHIGVGTPVNGDAIYNGALDNGAGSATLIEVAKATAAHPPRRSVLFISATAEEKGLLGAEYFAGNPTVPAANLVSMIDLDMPIITYNFTDVVAYGAEHSSLATFVSAAAADMGLKLSPDPIPEETIFVRSDHYAFVQKGVPAILLATGYGGEGAAARGKFMSTNYHQPSDDMNLPIHWDQGARFAELNWRIMERIANAADVPRWYQGDFFGDRFAPEAPKVARK